MSRILDSYSKLDQYLRELNQFEVPVESLMEQQSYILGYQKPNFSNKEPFDNATEKLDNLKIAIETYTKSIDEVKEYVSTKIREIEKSLIQHDYKHYEIQMFGSGVHEAKFKPDYQYVKSQWDNVTPEWDEFLNSKIQNLTTWQRATFDLWPLDGRYTQWLNAGDPLFILTENHTVDLDAIRSHFDDFFFNRRLRKYEKIEELPDNSVGLAVCINKFEYMPLDPIKDILKNVASKLVSGGKLLLSYNDCNKRPSLEQCVDKIRCFNNKETFSAMAFSLGYDVIESGSVNDGLHSFMVLQLGKTTQSIKINHPQLSVNLVQRMKNIAS